MKALSAGLLAHLQAETTTLSTCWKATLSNGKVYGFTDHTSDLVISGVTYQASTGYTPTDVQTSSALNVDNLEVEGLLNSPGITEADIQAGLWDYADIEIFQVNYLDLSQGTLKLRKGRIGEVRTGRSSFVAELRGLTQAYSRTIGELYSVTCRADLGDARCLVNLAPFTVIGTVTGVTSKRVFADTARAEAAAYFDYGKLTFTGGANNGLSMEVKTYTPGSVELAVSLPYAIQVGDTYSMHAGCAKRFTEDCKTKFNNVVNYRGEPHIPGIDKLLKPGGA